MPNHAVTSEFITFTMRVFQRVSSEKSNPRRIQDEFLPVFIKESFPITQSREGIISAHYRGQQGQEQAVISIINDWFMRSVRLLSV